MEEAHNDEIMFENIKNEKKVDKEAKDIFKRERNIIFPRKRISVQRKLLFPEFLKGKACEEQYEMKVEIEKCMKNFDETKSKLEMRIENEYW